MQCAIQCIYIHTYYYIQYNRLRQQGEIEPSQRTRGREEEETERTTRQVQGTKSKTTRSTPQGKEPPPPLSIYFVYNFLCLHVPSSSMCVILNNIIPLTSHTLTHTNIQTYIHTYKFLKNRLLQETIKEKGIPISISISVSSLYLYL